MTTWQRYTDTRDEHTIVGELLIQPEFYSPQLDNRRDLLVWLPPSYHTSDKRYPVIYMHDGHELFDAKADLDGRITEWQVDETMTTLADEGIEAIIVGIPNMLDRRFIEYCPFVHDQPPWPIKVPQGDTYLRFIIDTVKPAIDAGFRTRPDAVHTGLAGSSMGGLITLYGFLRHPQVFGLAGSFSPAPWLGGDALKRIVEDLATGHGRLYLDVGTDEGLVYQYHADSTLTEQQGGIRYRDGVRDLRDALQARGYNTDNFRYVEEEGGRHDQFAWARRLPDAFRFLLESQ